MSRTIGLASGFPARLRSIISPSSDIARDEAIVTPEGDSPAAQVMTPIGCLDSLDRSSDSIRLSLTALDEGYQL
jgi:hypothetical protein